MQSSLSKSLIIIRQEIERARGRIWYLKPESRIRILNHLAVSGSSDLVDLLGEWSLEFQPDHSNDIVSMYVRWVQSHLERGERPAFDLSNSAMSEKAPRVLLVSPIYRLHEASIGLVRIGFFLRGLGIKADWRAATPDNLDDILHQIANTKYDLIGQGTTHYTFNEDLRFLTRMAKISPQSEIILGGHGAKFAPSMLRQVLTDTPVKYVVRGFGERSTARLLIGLRPDFFDFAFPPCRIPGIHFLRAGQVQSTINEVYTELQFRVLHAIFDSKLYPVEQGIARLITSTHCPFNCVFCSSRNFVEQPATRLDPSDVTHLINELRGHYPNLKKVEFNDDNFSIGYRQNGKFRSGTDWLRELCEVSSKYNFGDLQTYCYSRADTIDSDTLTRLHKEINLSKIGFGLEHVDRTILKAMKKGTRVDRVLMRIRQSIDLGIDTNFFIILFSKWETRSSLLNLLEVSSQLVLEGANVVYNWGIQPLRGADVSEDLSNEYISSQERVGEFQFEQRVKIVPDDQQMAHWFRRMNDDLERYFVLQNELQSKIEKLREESLLDDTSPWFKQIFKSHQNVNLSNTLTNLIRFHSMFEYGRQYLDPKDLYFVDGANRTLEFIHAYVFSGPTFSHDCSHTSIARKISFLKESIDIAWVSKEDSQLCAELDVVRVGMRSPQRLTIKPNSKDHHVYAENSILRWRQAITHVDTSMEGGAFTVNALKEIENMLKGVPIKHEIQTKVFPNAKRQGYIL